MLQRLDPIGFADTPDVADDVHRPMPQVARLLCPERIALDVPVADEQALFAHIAAQVPLRDRNSTALIARRLARRHARRSTALGGGVALPHAEITHLRAAQAYFVRIARPLPFGAADGRPVRDVLALLVPKPATSIEHALLLDLTRWLSQPAVRRGLAASRTVHGVWRLFVGDAGT